MIITLCGSTRFKQQFLDWNARLGLLGHAVFNLSMFGRQDSDIGKAEDLVPITDEQKIILDLVHLKKIAVSDAILALNVDKYIGDSTRREIAWTRMQRRCTVVWLEFDEPKMRSGDRTVHNMGWLKDA